MTPLNNNPLAKIGQLLGSRPLCLKNGSFTLLFLSLSLSLSLTLGKRNFSTWHQFIFSVINLGCCWLLVSDSIVWMKNVIKILSLTLHSYFLAHPFGETVRGERLLINSLLWLEQQCRISIQSDRLCDDSRGKKKFYCTRFHPPVLNEMRLLRWKPDFCHE